MTKIQTLTSAERMNTEQFLAYNREYSKNLKAKYLSMIANKANFTAQQIEMTRIECCSLGIFV